MKKKSKRMSKSAYEKSAMDKKIDKITGYKEGSKKDEAMDKVVSSKMRSKSYRKPKLGSGARFKQLKGKLAAKGATNPSALAAYIGRKKYGAKKMGKLSAAGKKKRSASTPSGAKNPFGPLKTDKVAGAGRVFSGGMITRTSPQNRLNTGKTLLAKAMKRLSKRSK